MTLKRRLPVLLLCALTGLMMLLYAGHAAQHMQGHHGARGECAVCGVMEGWLSLLGRAAAAALAVLLSFAAVRTALALPLAAFTLRQDITPVTLKVKMTR